MEKLDENYFPKYGSRSRDENLLWKTLSRRLASDCHIFKVFSVQRTSRDGREGTFFQIDSPDWATMLPIFKGKNGKEYFIMEKQFRHGSQKVTIEFPSGLVEKGETPEQAAKRELLEETGLVCQKIRLMGKVCPNSAFMTNTSNFFLMEDLFVAGEQSLDKNEQIEVISVPVETAISQMGTGLFDNGMMMLALGFYLRGKINGEF